MDFAAARSNMVESQVRTNRVTDTRVVSALMDIPRERFVPEPKRGIAYVDEAILLGEGRYLVEPMILARLLQEAAVTLSDVALVVGSASGYAAAVLARLAGTVVALESSPALVAESTALLSDVGADNVAVVAGDLTAGYPKQAPYDVVYFDGAIAAVPDAIAAQTRDGSRIVAVVRPDDGPGRGSLFLNVSGAKSADDLACRDLFDGGTPYLPGFEPRSAFVF